MSKKLPNLAQRIRSLREQARFSQSELAARSGLTQSAISQIESGQISQLKGSAIAGLAKALHVQAEVLVPSALDVLSSIVQSVDEAKCSRLIEIFRELTPVKQDHLLKYAHFLFSEEEASISIEGDKALKRLIKKDLTRKT